MSSGLWQLQPACGCLWSISNGKLAFVGKCCHGRRLLLAAHVASSSMLDRSLATAWTNHLCFGVGHRDWIAVDLPKSTIWYVADQLTRMFFFVAWFPSCADTIR